MKPLLLLLFTVFASTSLLAQTMLPKRFQYTPGTGLQELRDGAWKNVLSDSLANRYSIASLQSKKPGVYRLPQDGMPCIVPDSTKTVRIPNLWRGSTEVPYTGKPPRIPNVARPSFLSYASR